MLKKTQKDSVQLVLLWLRIAFDACKKANSLNKDKGKPIWGVFEAINNAKEFFINKGVVMNGSDV